MNERVMQFRIGMFVIVAGLVLTMLIIWFGESPALFRDQAFVVVHYVEAPGVSEGIPVRKSGIHVGAVTAIEFDERENQPDGVLVTMAIDRKFKIKAGTVPMISRSLIGDVAIDLQPGTGPGWLAMSHSAAGAPIIEGTVAPDPSKALAAATKAFEKVGDTLISINDAAAGIAKVTKNAENVGTLMTTWDQTGKKMTAAADGIDRFIKANEADFQPAVKNLREVSQKLNTTLDPATQDALKTGISNFSSASSQLKTSLANASPLFVDLGASSNSVPKTDFGQTVRRLNIISSDINALTRNLTDGRGNLNPNGSLQKLILKAELYDNFNRMALSANDTFASLKAVAASFRVFADKVSRDPSSIARGALRSQ